MSEDIYNIFEAKFSNFTNPANGGVVSITRDINLYVSVCSFYRCIASGNIGRFRSPRNFA